MHPHAEIVNVRYIFHKSIRDCGNGFQLRLVLFSGINQTFIQFENYEDAVSAEPFVSAIHSSNVSVMAPFYNCAYSFLSL
jgi:hypothetical protein